MSVGPDTIGNISHTSTNERRPVVLAAWQLKIVLGLLVGFSLVWAMLSPVGMPAGPGTWQWLVYLWIGAFFAQPALVVIWTALASEPRVVRWPRGIALVALLAAIGLWASRQTNMNMLGDSDLALPVMMFTQFAALLIPLGILRRVPLWRLVRVARPSFESNRDDLQFSFTRMLVWVAGLALFFAVFAWLFHGASGTWEDLFSWMVAGLLLGAIATIATLPVIACLGAVLAVRKRRVFLIWIFVSAGMILTPVVVLLILYGRFDWSAITEFGFAVVGLYAISLATFSIVRLCGVRLVDRRDILNLQLSSALNDETADDEKCRKRRFALLVTMLLVALAALLWPAWSAYEARKEIAILNRFRNEWSRLGATIATDENATVTNVVVPPGQPVSSKLLDRMIREQNLILLVLSGSRLTDEQLAKIAHMDQLEQLRLNNTNITDAGLAHLHSMRQLRFLNLEGTKVTPAGVERLQKALPDCQITYTPPPKSSK